MTPQLFHESLFDAMTEIVRELGGYKVVGKLLRADKTPDVAGRLLNDCLNPNRSERLDPDQLLMLLREARKISAHAAINHILREAGYADAQPVEPEDERAALQRTFIQGVQTLTALASRLERVAL